MGDPHRQADRVAAPHLDRFLENLGPPPLAPVQIIGRVGILEPFQVQVLVVGAGMGDAPSRPFGVAEMGKAGYAGDCQPYHVKLGAGDMALVINVWRVQGAVRVAGQKRLAAGGTVAGNHPAIAAAGGFPQVVEGGSSPAQFGQAGIRRPGIGCSRRQDLQLAGRIARGQGSGLFRPQLANQLRLPYLGLKHAHQDVAHLENYQAVPGLPGFRAQAGDGILNRQRACGGRGLDVGVDSPGVSVQHLTGMVVHRLVIGPGAGFQAKAAHQQVLLQRLRTYHLGPTSAAPAPVVLHLPQPVLGGDKPLGKKGVRLAAGPQVGDAPAVAVHLGGGAQPLEGNGAVGFGQGLG